MREAARGGGSLLVTLDDRTQDRAIGPADAKICPLQLGVHAPPPLRTEEAAVQGPDDAGSGGAGSGAAQVGAGRGRKTALDMVEECVAAEFAVEDEPGGDDEGAIDVFFFFFFYIDRSSEEKTTETVGHVDVGTAKV